MSFWWIIPLLFSLAGIISVWCRSRMPWLPALITAVGGILLLILFFGTLWHSL